MLYINNLMVVEKNKTENYGGKICLFDMNCMNNMRKLAENKKWKEITISNSYEYL